MLVPLSTSGSIVTLNNFWNAIFLYHDRPHIVNRKLSGFSLAYFYKINYESSNKLTEIINYSSIIYETNKLSELSKAGLKNLLKNLVEPYDKSCEICETSPDIAKADLNGVYVSIRILFASNPRSSNCVELVVLDKNKNLATFTCATVKNKFELIAPPFPYTFEFTSSGHVKLVIDLEDADSTSAEWLGEKLFPKVMKWAEEYDKSAVHQQSLSLVSIERYCALYKALKNKYGKKIVEIWPENTDPLKFVYEDIAIATYLICLWEITNPKQKPNFIDLGCGNGLLVYILTEEGFIGTGIDVRRRKIWDLYPEHIKLEVKTIIPSASSLFPNADWIIGNHSDELTPWIPVIAARSSPSTNFFVLPCCSYDFNGSKYMRINPNRSQYNEYMEYIENISKLCGFNVQVDKLRIPSTKRTCIVSFNRNYSSNFKQVDADIKNFINSRCGATRDGTQWVENYQAREVHEKVRNCTQLNKNLINKIINTVVNELLKIEIFADEQKKWNAGGVVTLEKLVKSIECDDLKQLKNECGGLQTLLKNHRYIFEVVQGSVKLRIPLLFHDVQKYKSKPCWFFRNHPNGCIHEFDTCAYGH